MSKVLFVNGNLHGHINPTIPLVFELVERGEEVWYYCSESFKERIISTGASILPAGKYMEDFYHSYRPTGEHPFYTLIEYIVRYDYVLIKELLEQIKDMEFDYIICDSMLGAGYFLKQILRLPMICSISTFAMQQLPLPEHMLKEGFHPQLDEFYRVARIISSEWNIVESSAYDVFTGSGDLNIVYTSKEFNPGGEAFDDSYVFIGPSMQKREENVHIPILKSIDKKIIYISLGTINTDFNHFYKLCIDSFRDSNYNVIMSVGKKCNISDLGNIPDNFIIKNYVPQLDILQKSSIFISHGGFNSISESLYYGVPIIAIPIANDQHMVAKRLMELGAGITLDMKEITVPILQQSVNNIIIDKNFYKSCKKISASFQQAGGCKMAVNEIIKLGDNMNGD